MLLTQLSLAEEQRQQQRLVAEDAHFPPSHAVTGPVGTHPPMTAVGRVASAPSLLASQPATCCLDNVLPIAVGAPLLRDLLCLEAALLGCPEAQGLSALRGALVRCKTKGSYSWQQIRGVAQTDGEWMLTVGQGRQLTLVHPKFISSNPKNKSEAGVQAELQELSTRWPAMMSSRQQVAEIQWALEGATSQLHKILERKQLALGGASVPVSSAALGALIETLRMPDGPPFRLLFVQPVSSEEAAAAAAALAAQAAAAAQAATMPAAGQDRAPAAAPAALPHLPPGFDGSCALAAPAAAAPLPAPSQQQQQQQQSEPAGAMAPLQVDFGTRLAAPAPALQPQLPDTSLELPPWFASRKSAAAPAPQRQQAQLQLEQLRAEPSLPPGFAPTHTTAALQQELSNSGSLMPPGMGGKQLASRSMPEQQQMPARSLPTQLQAGAGAGGSTAPPPQSAVGKSGTVPAVDGTTPATAAAPAPINASSAAVAAAGVVSLAAAAQAIQQASSSLGGLSAPSLLLGIKADLERLLAAAGAAPRLGSTQLQDPTTMTGKQLLATLQHAASGAAAVAGGPTSSGGSGTGGWPAAPLQAPPVFGGGGAALPAEQAGAARRAQQLESRSDAQVRSPAESGSAERQRAARGSLAQQQEMPARQGGGSIGRLQQQPRERQQQPRERQRQQPERQQQRRETQGQRQQQQQQREFQQRATLRSLSEEGELPPEGPSCRPSDPPARNQPRQQSPRGTLEITVAAEGGERSSRWLQRERQGAAPSEREGRRRSRSRSRRRSRSRQRSRSRRRTAGSRGGDSSSWGRSGRCGGSRSSRSRSRRRSESRSRRRDGRRRSGSRGRRRSTSRGRRHDGRSNRVG